MRSLVAMFLLRLACRPTRQWVAAAFTSRPGVGGLSMRPSNGTTPARRTTPQQQQWMGTQQQQQQQEEGQVQQERTPEEMERIKAEREARK